MKVHRRPSLCSRIGINGNRAPRLSTSLVVCLQVAGCLENPPSSPFIMLSLVPESRVALRNYARPCCAHMNRQVRVNKSSREFGFGPLVHAPRACTPGPLPVSCSVSHALLYRRPLPSRGVPDLAGQGCRADVAPGHGQGVELVRELGHRTGSVADRHRLAMFLATARLRLPFGTSLVVCRSVTGASS